MCNSVKNRELNKLLDSIIELICLKNNDVLSSFVGNLKKVESSINCHILEFLTDCNVNSIDLSKIFIIALELSYPSRTILHPSFDLRNPQITPNDLVTCPFQYIVPRIQCQIGILAPFLKPILPYFIMNGNQDFYFEIGETLNLYFYLPRIYSSDPIEDLFAFTLILLLFTDLFALRDYYQNETSLFVAFDLMRQLIEAIGKQQIVFEYRYPYFNLAYEHYITESIMRSLSRAFSFRIRLRKIDPRYEDFHIFNAIVKWRFYNDYIKPMLKYLNIFSKPFYECIPIEFIDLKYRRFINRYITRFIINLAGIESKNFVELPMQLQERDVRNIRI